jgi:hypothetical protein
VVADADRSKGDPDGHPEINRQLMKMAGLEPIDFPPTTITGQLAIWEENYDVSVAQAIEDYDTHLEQARAELGAVNKPALARRVAERLVEEARIPEPILELIEAIRKLVPRKRDTNGSTGGPGSPGYTQSTAIPDAFEDDPDIPF